MLGVWGFWYERSRMNQRQEKVKRGKFSEGKPAKERAREEVKSR